MLIKNLPKLQSCQFLPQKGRQIDRKIVKFIKKNKYLDILFAVIINYLQFKKFTHGCVLLIIGSMYYLEVTETTQHCVGFRIWQCRVYNGGTASQKTFLKGFLCFFSHIF